MRVLLPIINCESWVEHIKGARCSSKNHLVTTEDCRLCNIRKVVDPSKDFILKDRGNSTPVATVAFGWNPKDESTWPLLVRKLSKLRNETDRGLGDTIHRRLGAAGRVFQKLHKKLLGRDCGCGDRQIRFNEYFPYSQTKGDSQ